MKAVCLGSLGFHDNETSHTACYMIPDLGIVFDAGTGFFRVKKLLKTKFLDIFLSHGHMDHIGGFHSIIEMIEQKQVETIKVHGEEKVLKALKATWDDPYFPAVPGLKIEYCPISEGPIQCQSGAVVSWFWQKHTTTCVGYRVEYGGKVFAYMTDTSSRKDSPYVENVRNVDLLFHECYCDRGPDAERCGHTNVTDVVDFVKACGAKKFVVIHHNPNLNPEDILKSIQQDIPEAKAAREWEEYEW